MDLRTLECFLVIAEEGSITRAATRLHMSQPPLTVRLKALERELGVQLLVRHGRGVDLTVAGRVLVERARRLLSDAEDTGATVRSVGQGMSGRLSIALSCSVAPSVLADLLQRMRAEAPDVIFRVSDVTDEAALDRVDHGEADAGMVLLAPRDPSAADLTPPRPRPTTERKRALETAVVAREPLVAVLRSEHAEAQKERANLAALTHHTLIAPSRSRAPGLYEHISGAWRAVEGDSDLIQETDSPTTMMALVKAGVGVAIVPASLAEVSWDGLAAVPLRQHRPAAETAIVWRHSTTSPVLRRFLRLALSTPEPDVLGPLRARSTPGRDDDYH
jgi:DNA-binding transcriptional LysR family regulator